MKRKLNKAARVGTAASEFDRGVVTSYLAARTKPAPDTRMRAIDVWEDFCAWCEVAGKSNIGRRHMYAVLRERNLYGKHSGQTWCFGIALSEARNGG